MTTHHRHPARPRQGRGRHAPTGFGGAAGFTLMEMMVALVVTGLVVGAVFATLFRSQRAGQTMQASVGQRQGARAAIQLLERELRMAGSGWGRMPVEVWYSSEYDSAYAVWPGPGAGDCDSVTIVGGWDVMTTVAVAMPNPSSVLRVASTAGFAEGDLCVITDGLSAHLFQVTQVNGSSGMLQHNPSSPYNPPGGVNLHAWPAGGYGIGARVHKVGWVTYLVDSTGFGRPSLVRRAAGEAPQLVAHDISRFQVRYRMQDSTLTRDPADVRMVDEVVPVVWTRLAIPGHTVYGDSVWAVVRPRTF